MSSSRRNRLRIEDILESIEYLRDTFGSLIFEHFSEDRTTVLAVLHSLQIAGEAASSLPDEFREEHPEFPWQEMRRMRNFIAHQYFGVNLDTIWDTIHDDFLPLEQNFRRLLEAIPGDG